MREVLVAIGFITIVVLSLPPLTWAFHLWAQLWVIP